MLKHLYAGGSAPPEYIEMILCRDIYHCTPGELAQIPLDTILAHLICLREEQEWAKDKQRSKGGS